MPRRRQAKGQKGSKPNFDTIMRRRNWKGISPADRMQDNLCNLYVERGMPLGEARSLAERNTNSTLILGDEDWTF